MVASPTKVCCLSSEGHKPPGRKQNGLMNLPKSADLETLKNISRRVMEVLQSKITLTSPDGVVLPLLMTRVDMGLMQDGEFKPWVNEVEFVPSYYLEDHTHPLEATVANQCVIIAKKFLSIDSNLANNQADDISSRATTKAFENVFDLEKPSVLVKNLIHNDKNSLLNDRDQVVKTMNSPMAGNDMRMDIDVQRMN